MGRVSHMKALDLIVTGLNAALYAGFGYLTYLGIFTPIVGVVRFWPSVVSPAVFANLFGPMVGGVGAAIGIFISDLLIHGNALLSLLVGVPSNFIGFYLVGYIGRRDVRTSFILISNILGFVFAFASIGLLVQNLLDPFTSYLFAGICFFSAALALIINFIWPEWKSIGIGSIVGLGVGGAIIGMGVWAFSQFFILPSGEMLLPLYASVSWFIWTYATEIPFLIILVPPILKACYLAFPGLRPSKRR